MKFKDIFTRVGDRVKATQNKMNKAASTGVKKAMDMFSDEWMDQAFYRARNLLAPSIEHLPVDFQLRQSSWPRRLYEKIFPVSHVLRLSHRYDRLFLEDYMPIDGNAYIGRGSYKFVYKLPWRMVVKVGKPILPSDPIFGSLFRQVANNLEEYLSDEELKILEELTVGRGSSYLNRMRLNFIRLGLERYHYWKVREALPDLVLPTRFFMGIRYRKRWSRRGEIGEILPMDNQIMLIGKHLKEFARAAKRSEQNVILDRLSPKFDFTFDVGRFGSVKKKTIEKIILDVQRLISFTRKLAIEENLVLDIHTENIIITLPEFELKVFDFHLFDQHLYSATDQSFDSEQDHIAVLAQFTHDLEKLL